MIRLPPSPIQDPWSSFDDEDEDEPVPRVQAQAGPSRSRKSSRSISSPQDPSPNSSPTQRHPLHSNESSKVDIDDRALNGRYPGLGGLGGLGVDVLSDVSRPALRRLTSETERQVAESSRSGSERGSLDLLRMSVADPGAEEVEVLIHHVKPVESIVGIALLYGIDVATLRKINKLWASDPVHLRTHLYVPLEACKWTKARDTFTRGPGDGQVTLTPKNAKSKGKQKEQGDAGQQASASLIDLDTPLAEKSHLSDFDAWEESAREYMPSTNLNYTRASVDTPRQSIDDVPRDKELECPGEPPRVLDIVRIPRSRLQFFPKHQHRPSESRSSFESQSQSHHSRASPRRPSGPSQKANGPSIQNDLSTLPLPLQRRHQSPQSKSQQSSKFVRLRPPTAPPMNGVSFAPAHQQSQVNTLANRISNLFTVPPPPSTDLFASTSRRASSSPSVTFSLPGSGASTPARTQFHHHHEAPLELRPRTSLEGTDRSAPKRNGHHRSTSMSKKHD